MHFMLCQVPTALPLEIAEAEFDTGFVALLSSKKTFDGYFPIEPGLGHSTCFFLYLVQMTAFGDMC